MLVEPVDSYVLTTEDSTQYYYECSLSDWSNETLESYIGAAWELGSCEPARYIRFYINRIPRMMGFVYMHNPEIYGDSEVGIGIYNADTNHSECWSWNHQTSILLHESMDIANLTPRMLTDTVYDKRDLVMDLIGQSREGHFPYVWERNTGIYYSQEPLPKRITRKNRREIHDRMMNDVMINMIYTNCSWIDAVGHMCDYYVRNHSRFFCRFLGDKNLDDDWSCLEDTLSEHLKKTIEEDDFFWSNYLDEAESLEFLFRDIPIK